MKKVMEQTVRTNVAGDAHVVSFIPAINEEGRNVFPINVWLGEASFRQSVLFAHKSCCVYVCMEGGGGGNHEADVINEFTNHGCCCC